jgi:hypothetical protein
MSSYVLQIYSNEGSPSPEGWPNLWLGIRDKELIIVNGAEFAMPAHRDMAAGKGGLRDR